MFKPQTFRFANTIHWPGAGPTNEIHTDHVSCVKDEGDEYCFHHASGYAIKIPKSAVTTQGIWDHDDIPNLPDEDADSDDDSSKSSRLGGNRTPVPGTLQGEAKSAALDIDQQQPFFAGQHANVPADKTGDKEDGALSSAVETGDTDSAESDDQFGSSVDESKDAEEGSEIAGGPSDDDLDASDDQPQLSDVLNEGTEVSKKDKKAKKSKKTTSYTEF